MRKRRPARRQPHSDDQRITIKTRGGQNPKRPGCKAWHRFNLYRPGMAVRHYLSIGGHRRDLHWDEEHGFIELVDRP